jgi:hypothetical protein
VQTSDGVDLCPAVYALAGESAIGPLRELRSRPPDAGDGFRQTGWRDRPRIWRIRRIFADKTIDNPRESAVILSQITLSQ